MPQTSPHLPDPRAERPRVGLFLVPANRRAAPLADEAAWHGLDAQRLAWLIRHYTCDGDAVLDLDNHPTVAHAARYLHRHPATLTTDGDHLRVTNDRLTADRPAAGDGVALLLAGLPRPDSDHLTVHVLTEAMHQWHRMLRPRGYLLTALAATATRPGRVSQRSTVITAARAAGLRYHQHLPVLLVALPDTEPRTNPATAGSIEPALLDGRHAPTHMDILAFAASTTDQETTHA